MLGEGNHELLDLAVLYHLLLDVVQFLLKQGRDHAVFVVQPGQGLSDPDFAAARGGLVAFGGLDHVVDLYLLKLAGLVAG
jgi:hypothetical protein